MEFSVESISPVEKKINVTVSPSEVDAAIIGSVAVYKDSVRLDGFRPGKVPASVIEKRFHDQIYTEARQDLINANINEITNQLNLEPISGINIDGLDKPLQRGEFFSYSMKFEVLPEFELPNYEGLVVEQEKVVEKEEDINKILKRIQKEHAKLVPVEGKEPGKDGQIVNLDFEAFEDGVPLPDIKTENFDLELGANASLPEFEELVKTIAPGETGSRNIKFPDDFISPNVAGKNIEMHVTVHAVKEAQLPPLDDDFAKSLKLENLEQLKDNVKKSYVQSKEMLNRGVAQKNLLDGLLKQCEFPLPESLVELEIKFLLADLAGRLEKQGRSLGALGKSLDELKNEMMPQAKEFARSQILLHTIAKKEGLSVNENEIQAQIFKNCLRTGQDFKAMREEYERSGLIFQLRDKLLADKAMDLVYAKANIKFTDTPSPEEPALSEANYQE